MSVALDSEYVVFMYKLSMRSAPAHTHTYIHTHTHIYTYADAIHTYTHTHTHTHVAPTIPIKCKAQHPHTHYKRPQSTFDEPIEFVQGLVHCHAEVQAAGKGKRGGGGAV